MQLRTKNKNNKNATVVGESRIYDQCHQECERAEPPERIKKNVYLTIIMQLRNDKTLQLLANLAFMNNAIKSVNELNHLSGFKDRLCELLLHGK
jgi:hypothetical protein